MLLNLYLWIISLRKTTDSAMEKESIKKLINELDKELDYVMIDKKIRDSIYHCLKKESKRRIDRMKNDKQNT